jgi:hypothetical protein
MLTRNERPRPSGSRFREKLTEADDWLAASPCWSARELRSNRNGSTPCLGSGNFVDARATTGCGDRLAGPALAMLTIRLRSRGGAG